MTRLLARLHQEPQLATADKTGAGVIAHVGLGRAHPGLAAVAVVDVSGGVVPAATRDEDGRLVVAAVGARGRTTVSTS